MLLICCTSRSSNKAPSVHRLYMLWIFVSTVIEETAAIRVGWNTCPYYQPHRYVGHERECLCELSYPTSLMDSPLDAMTKVCVVILERVLDKPIPYLASRNGDRDSVIRLFRPHSHCYCCLNAARMTIPFACKMHVDNTEFFAVNKANIFE